MTSDANLDVDKAITECCKIGLVSKFTFELMTTKVSHHLNPCFWPVVAKSSCGICII